MSNRADGSIHAVKALLHNSTTSRPFYNAGLDHTHTHVVPRSPMRPDWFEGLNQDKAEEVGLIILTLNLTDGMDGRVEG